MKDMRSIGNKSIFGEYSMGENRVTAALLHIIRLCGIELVKELSILTSNHIRYSNSALVFGFVILSMEISTQTCVLHKYKDFF